MTVKQYPYPGNDSVQKEIKVNWVSGSFQSQICVIFKMKSNVSYHPGGQMQLMFFFSFSCVLKIFQNSAFFIIKFILYFLPLVGEKKPNSMYLSKTELPETGRHSNTTNNMQHKESTSLYFRVLVNKVGNGILWAVRKR